MVPLNLRAVADTIDKLYKSAELKPDTPLKPYQERVADTGAEPSARKLIYHALGTGKTLSAIGAAEKAGDPYTAVVPASLRPNFMKERAKWTDQKTPAQLTSYNAMARGTGPTDTRTLIVDEAHRLRNEGSQQTKAVNDLAANADHVYMLSGSPIVNRPGDLAPLLSILRNEPITSESFEKQFVGEQEVQPGFFDWLFGMKSTKVPKLQNEDKLRQMFEGLVDYEGTPPPDVDVREEEQTVEMSPEQHKLYQGFWNKLPWMLRWKMQKDFPLSQPEMTRLNSFIAGPRQVGLSTLPFMTENPDPMRAYQQSPKLQAALADVKAQIAKNPNFQGAAFSNFVDAGLVPYQKALEAEGIAADIFHGGLSDQQRMAVVDRLNNRQSKMLLLGPSGGEGLDLHRLRLLQVLDPHWNEARSDQAIGRGIRIGSHADLPPEERNILIKRYMSTVPANWQQRWFGPDADKNKDGADYFLTRLMRQKQQLNDQFLKVLQDVGTPDKTAMVVNLPPHLLELIPG